MIQSFSNQSQCDGFSFQKLFWDEPLPQTKKIWKFLAFSNH